MSVRRFVDKIAVDSEPGLSNAQLMLTNDDLRPGICSLPSRMRRRTDMMQQSLPNAGNGAGGISLLSGLPILRTSYVSSRNENFE